MNRLLGAAVLCLATAVSAGAEAAARLSTQVSATRVEVGQQFTLQLTCLVDAGTGSPSDPQLSVPRTFATQRPSISTQQNVSIINGQIQQQSGVTATWVLSASATGRFRLGPASIVVGGQRLSDRPLDVEVVAQGTLPRPNRLHRGGRGFDPFDLLDPFGGSDPFSGPMFPPGLRTLPQPQADEVPAHPPDLNFEKARDPIAFLDARLTTTRVVVGEQTTLRIYAYGKPAPFNLEGGTEPSRNDFLSYQNERDNALSSIYRIRVDSELWYGRRILSYALFPTKTGRLTIGKMEANFVGAGLLGSNAYQNVHRESQPLEVIVEEPPLKGRPPGYHLGDVGDFTLTATVEPRRVKASESISVQLEVAGTGQLPQRLDPPEQTGVEWLEPTVTQQIDDQRDRIAGKRQFNYVVRIGRVGEVDLGTMRFPYFDPTTRRYAVAEAKLGKIQVEASPADTKSAAATDSLSGDPLLTALKPRKQLGDEGQPRQYLADEKGFLYWLLGGPLLALAGFGLRAAWQRWSRWRKDTGASARHLVDADLKSMQQALAANDARQAAGHAERLLHLAVELSIGLKSRGVLRSELAAQLEQRGLSAEQGRAIAAMLDRADHVRFVDASIEQAQSLGKDVETLVQAMLPLMKRSKRRGS